MNTRYTPKSTLESNLFKAFVALKSTEDIGNFLRDLLTPSELSEFANRLEIARLLTTGKSYLEIAKEVGVSTTTVTRVSQWLHDGCGGYVKVLKMQKPV